VCPIDESSILLGNMSCDEEVVWSITSETRWLCHNLDNAKKSEMASSLFVFFFYRSHTM